ncbi:protein kinase domain-containing protein [Kitasatospora purpeofusca]|uniref:serine/threonine-protein kinase n=1 Tax=Kitasatospora purpeofusca TaxID=67352 RepID=UPI003822C225
MTGQILAGRYRLTGQLGAGGMGVVWRAEDLVLHRTVAVKTIAAGPGVAVEAAARLRREARAAAGLSDSPHVVTVHDFDQDGDILFIVMELAPGRTLDRVLASDGPPSPARAVDWSRQVCAALAFAHEHGIVHRDIKPANVILTPDGTVKVLDFGIAWFHPALGLEQLSRSDSVLGSAPWMSPEQAHGQGFGPASDLYSLGCLLHHLLTGAPPFAGRELLAQLVAHASEIPEPPSRSRPGLPPELDALVAELLAKDPEQRPASATETAARLGAVAALLGAQPTAGPAPRPSPPPRPPLPPVGAAPAEPGSPPRSAAPADDRKVSRRSVLLGVGVVVVTGGATAALVPRFLDGGKGSGGGGGATTAASPGATAQPVRPRWTVPGNDVPAGQVGPLLMTNAGPQDARSGKVVWPYPGQATPIHDALRLSSDSILVLDGDTVQCLDIVTGKARWSRELRIDSGEVSDGAHHIVVADNALYVGIGKHVWRLDPTSGAVVWTYVIRRDLGQLRRLDLASGAILVNDDGKSWLAISPDTGQDLWNHQPANSSEDQELAGSTDDRIYFKGTKELHTVAAADGKVLGPLQADGQVVPEYGLVAGQAPADTYTSSAWNLTDGRRLWGISGTRVMRRWDTALQLRYNTLNPGNRIVDIRNGTTLWDAPDLRDLMPENWKATARPGPPWCFSPLGSDSDLVLVDPVSGRRSRPVRFPQRMVRWAQVLGDAVYVMCDDGQKVGDSLVNPAVYAIDRPDSQ